MRMGEAERIADQMRRAFHGGAWHGPSIRELLEGVDARVAGARPLPAAHTIAEIVAHLSAWNDTVRRRVEGEPVALGVGEDWPPVVGGSEEAWRRRVAELEARQEALLEGVGRLGDDRLGARVPGQEYDVRFMLHGVIQHDLYHAGQIALLKKAGV